MLNEAVEFATKAHEGQFRKGTKRPYIVHPIEVADIVTTMTRDPEVICAAVLIYVFALIPLCGGLTREYGFVIASFIFLCVTIKFFNEISFPKTLLISASAVIIIYVVFHFGLKVIMPK